jgi:hypothetical protein
MFDATPHRWPRIPPVHEAQDRPPDPPTLLEPQVRALLSARPVAGFGAGAPPLHALTRGG